MAVEKQSMPSFASIISVLSIVFYFVGFIRVELQINEQKGRISTLESAAEAKLLSDDADIKITKNAPDIQKLHRNRRQVDSTKNASEALSTAEVLDKMNKLLSSGRLHLCQSNGVPCSACPPGPSGPPGPRGDKGSRGRRGQKGRTGNKGDNGIMGSPGKSGKQGIMGPAGLSGETGTKGEKGELGLAGMTGTKGDIGMPGTKGDIGPTGMRGTKGDKGTASIPGTKGDKGATGIPGTKGHKGAAGIPGTKGRKGATGKSGTKGNKGATGIPGTKGHKGAAGIPGTKGRNGAAGIPGTKGDRGATGIPGTKGEPGRGFVCGPVGVEDRNTIPDARMTASTLFNSGYYPYYGRLNENRGKGAWCTKTTSDRTDYLQVDMGAVRYVCAVATQGRIVNVWTTSYKVHFSTDGVTWSVYRENNVEKVFAGNTDQNTVVKHSLSTDVKARFVRFYPVTHKGHPCLTVEIFVLN